MSLISLGSCAAFLAKSAANLLVIDRIHMAINETPIWFVVFFSLCIFYNVLSHSCHLRLTKVRILSCWWQLACRRFSKLLQNREERSFPFIVETFFAAPLIPVRISGPRDANAEKLRLRSCSASMDPSLKEVLTNIFTRPLSITHACTCIYVVCVELFVVASTTIYTVLFLIVIISFSLKGFCGARETNILSRHIVSFSTIDCRGIPFKFLGLPDVVL